VYLLAPELKLIHMLIDAHVHLDKYGGLLDDALREIEQEQIFTVATAMDAPSYGELKVIAARSLLVLPTFGVHPRRAQQYASRLSDLGPLIEDSPAIGEIGLDFHWEKDASTYPAQRKVLGYFFAAAREQKKFVNLHTKGGEREILDLLVRYDLRRAIIHWYSGPMDILRELIAYGAFFTIGVEVHFSDHIKAIAQGVPDHLLLTETDNPGGLQWLKGELGKPKAIENVIEKVADLRQSTPERIERLVHANFTRLIADDQWLKPVAELLSRRRS
jgi:TatD DNase family protein